MKPKILSIIIPVYNEEKHLEKILRYLFNSKSQIAREWIIVEDCSKDTSLEIIKKLQSEFDFKLVVHEKNSGKGCAIRTGIAHATGDFTIIQDADFEYDPNDVPTLIEPLINDKADVVYGSRFKKSAQQVHRTYHYFVNRFLTILSNLMSGIYLTDMETCYKAFKTDILKSMNLTSRRFGIEVELTAYIAQTRARIIELPISYYPRNKLQGKKINWKDGFAALRHLIYYNYIVNKNKIFNNLPEHYKQPYLSQNYETQDSPASNV